MTAPPFEKGGRKLLKNFLKFFGDAEPFFQERKTDLPGEIGLDIQKNLCFFGGGLAHSTGLGGN
ncbi:MAG: hypothetical protein IKL24_04795, partial [Clostridia bacterium]|nr:hypothetical protein [Clostridia bacterium]